MSPVMARDKKGSVDPDGTTEPFLSLTSAIETPDSGHITHLITPLPAHGGTPTPLIARGRVLMG